MSDVDEAWEEFLDIGQDINLETSEKSEKMNINKIGKEEIPKASDIYISTKTIIGFLNSSINLNDIFWKLNILNYHEQKEGIIKKQIKINSSTPEELEIMRNKLKNLESVDEQIINHIENPNGRIKFRDTRKISIGICKKDILSYRSKKKGAFYNCFVVILRVLYEDIFKEIHIKVFNTGKLEIPGIQKDGLLKCSIKLLINILREITGNKEVNYLETSESTVLINSNFNCGFYIDREKLFNILRFDYGINSCYDPCSYPGIQCEFYYNKEKIENDGKQEFKQEKLENIILKISFMIFRTGSVLIVGKCNEEILNYIYNFIKELLAKEFLNIATEVLPNNNLQKYKKAKKKFITINA
jgi:hypothetical protein